MNLDHNRDLKKQDSNKSLDSTEPRIGSIAHAVEIANQSLSESAKSIFRMHPHQARKEILNGIKAVNFEGFKDTEIVSQVYLRAALIESDCFLNFRKASILIDKSERSLDPEKLNDRSLPHRIKQTSLIVNGALEGDYKLEEISRELNIASKLVLSQKKLPVERVSELVLRYFQVAKLNLETGNFNTALYYLQESGRIASKFLSSNSLQFSRAIHEVGSAFLSANNKEGALDAFSLATRTLSETDNESSTLFLSSAANQLVIRLGQKEQDEVGNLAEKLTANIGRVLEIQPELASKLFTALYTHLSRVEDYVGAQELISIFENSLKGECRKLFLSSPYVEACRAEIYYALKELPDAYESSVKALRLHRQNNLLNDTMLQLAEIGICSAHNLALTKQAIEMARERVAIAEVIYPGHVNRLKRALYMSDLARLCLDGSDLIDGIRHSRRCLSHLSGDFGSEQVSAVQTKATSYWVIGRAMYESGNFERSISIEKKGLDILTSYNSSDPEHKISRLTLQMGIAACSIEMGDFIRAGDTIHTCSNQISDATFDKRSEERFSAFLDILEGRLLFKNNNLEIAKDRIYRGLNKLQNCGADTKFTTASGHVTLGLISHAQGDYTGALLDLERGEEIFNGLRTRNFRRIEGLNLLATLSEQEGEISKSILLRRRSKLIEEYLARVPEVSF